MALSDIVQKIIEDAKTQARKIEQDTEHETSLILSENEKNIEKHKEEVRKNINEKEKLMENKTHILISGVNKNIILKKKRKILDDAFNNAKDKLTSIEESEIIRILSAAISSIKQTKGTIYPAKKYTDLLKKVIKDTGKSFIIGDEKEIIGGFLFFSDDLEIDFSFSNIIEKEIRPKIEIDVVRIIFDQI